MALDELHARRLATIANVFDDALDRMELVLKSLQSAGEEEREQTRQAREKMETVRSRLSESLKHFAIRLRKPGPRQVLAAELSRLWVVLENARPERMKGYGREFSATDKAAWDKLIEELMSDVKEMRRILVKGRLKP
jgi:hypothetical protein